MRIKCLTRARSPITQHRALLRTAQPGIQHSIHGATKLFLGDQSRHEIDIGSIKERKIIRGIHPLCGYINHICSIKMPLLMVRH